jgi:hypothetical protein
MNEQSRIITESQWKEYQMLAGKCCQLEEKVKDLEYKKHGVQCVLHDCFITLLKNNIINPGMKFYDDIVKAKDE